MEENLTKVEFRNFAKLKGSPGELIQAANEGLARSVSLSLSAFFRSSFTTAYTDGSQASFGDLVCRTTPPALDWLWSAETIVSCL